MLPLSGGTAKRPLQLSNAFTRKRRFTNKRSKQRIELRRFGEFRRRQHRIYRGFLHEMEEDRQREEVRALWEPDGLKRYREADLCL